MSVTEDRALGVAEAIDRLDCGRVGYVPSNTVAPIIIRLEEADRARGGPRRVFPVSREEEAVGIIGALPLTGSFGAIVMQDNGFGNALTALTTFSLAYHLPLLVVANTRGGLGEYNSMIHAVSGGVPDLLAAVGIPTFRLDRRNSPDDWRETVYEAGRHARMTFRPVVVLMEFWDGVAGGRKA
ncbi:MAG TPA: thiamine pyrophosphate-binding protein [Mycobacteriales bacterium]